MKTREINEQLAYERERGVYFDPSRPETLELDYFWTAFCGGCGEEIDVVAAWEGQAQRLVHLAIAADYEPVKIDYIERRSRGLIYF